MEMVVSVGIIIGDIDSEQNRHSTGIIGIIRTELDFIFRGVIDDSDFLFPEGREHKDIAVIDIIIALIFGIDLIILHGEPVCLSDLFRFGSGFIPEEEFLNRDFRDTIKVNIHRRKSETADSFFSRKADSLEEITEL